MQKTSYYNRLNSNLVGVFCIYSDASTNSKDYGDFRENVVYSMK